MRLAAGGVDLFDADECERGERAGAGGGEADDEEIGAEAIMRKVSSRTTPKTSAAPLKVLRRRPPQVISFNGGEQARRFPLQNCPAWNKYSCSPAD